MERWRVVVFCCRGYFVGLVIFAEVAFVGVIFLIFSAGLIFSVVLVLSFLSVLFMLARLPFCVWSSILSIHLFALCGGFVQMKKERKRC